MKIKTQKLGWAAAAVVISMTVACNQTEQKPEAEVEESVVLVEEEFSTFWIVSEDRINDIPLTTKTDNAEASPKSEASEKKPATTTAPDAPATPAATEETAYQVATKDELHTAFIAAQYEPMTEVTVEEYIVPLDETQTLVSYNGKGKYEDSVQVISDGEGNVQQIVFAHKKHKDEYNVENGMSAKDVKKLRKELKHMVKHGKIFLYEDTSNIMYMLDVTDVQGDEIIETEIDEMKVSAIIWKDKKHHHKDKKA